MANLGRSETPEATIHPHETRTSRRFGRELTREDTEEPQHFWVTLRPGRERLKKFFRDYKSKQSTPSGSQTPSLAHARAPSASAPHSMPPPSTPNATSTSSAAPATRTPSNGIPPGQIGRLEAPPPTAANPTPPPVRPFPHDSHQPKHSIFHYSSLSYDL
jgi:SWI/SNF-related matrix-associated actin-dependent regulator of chromatin subfamily B protein 1